MSSTVIFADPANELVTLTNTFYLNLVATDPTTVTLTVTDPLNNPVSYSYGGAGTITRTGEGAYLQDIAATADGLWQFEWTGTGAVTEVDVGTFTVAPAAVSHWYTSVEQLKSRVGITDTADDFECQLAVQAAAAEIQRITGRFFWKTPAGTVRTYRNTSIYDVDIDDLVSITQLATDQDGDGVYETVWTSSQYQLQVTDHQYNTASKGEPWPYTKIQALGVPGGNYLPYVWAWSHQDRVQVTGTFGWPAVPVLVRQASLMLATELFKQKDAPVGIPSGLTEYGPQIAAMLSRYVKPQVKVGV